MSAHVVCITSGAGLPVFTRRKGNTETLPFSMIGSLNGVHMFAKAQRLELLNTLMQDHCAVWKEFHDRLPTIFAPLLLIVSRNIQFCNTLVNKDRAGLKTLGMKDINILLIGISSGCTEQVLSKFLQSVFNAMVLVVGIEGIKSQRNVERLKRELRLCYPVVDRLLDSLDCGDTSNKHSSDLITMVETILCTENNLIKTVLESYTECIDSVYSCILIHGKIAVATDSWWELHPDELKLLSLLATIENTTNSKDIPVFLPYKSSNVAYRFVAVMLVPNVQICCLCGPTPLLEDIEHSAAQCFKSTLEVLEQAVQCHPKNFPHSLDAEFGILGVLLINIKCGKYMISRYPTNTSIKSSGNGFHRLDVLRTFYYQTVMGTLVADDLENLTTVEKKEQDKSPRKVDKNLKKSNNNAEYTVCTETYWCSEYHKCHAVVVDDNVLCALYNSSIPTHTMRFTTPKILKILVMDKQVCW